MTTAPATTKSPVKRDGANGAHFFNRPPKPYVNPYLGGAILGVILFLAFFFTGNGLGSSGATTRIDAALVDAVAPQRLVPGEHVLVHAVDQRAVEIEDEGGLACRHGETPR